MVSVAGALPDDSNPPRSPTEQSEGEPWTSAADMTDAVEPENAESADDMMPFVHGGDVDIGPQSGYKGDFVMFSHVSTGPDSIAVQCLDKERKFVMVKIYHKSPQSKVAALRESQMMLTANDADKEDVMPVARLKNIFTNDLGHMCLVMPRYGPSLLACVQETMAKARWRKLPALPHRVIASVGFQTAVALHFLRSERFLIHSTHQARREHRRRRHAAPRGSSLSLVAHVAAFEAPGGRGRSRTARSISDAIDMRRPRSYFASHAGDHLRRDPRVTRLRHLGRSSRSSGLTPLSRR